MPGIEFKQVADRLTAEQFARNHLRLRGNRAQCPFHGGEHYNLQFFRDGKCHCHVCHRGGDVVALAAATWGTTQAEAAALLNDEYHLGLNGGGRPSAAVLEARQRERQERDHQRDEQRERWGAACDREREARQLLERFTAADADKPEFNQALARMVAAQTELDMMWAGVTGQ